jgi:sortase A
MTESRGASERGPLIDSPRPKPGLRRITTTGLIAGVVLVAIGAWQLFGTGIVAAHEQAKLRKTFVNTRAKPRIGRPVGRILIPRIGLDLVVVEGVGLRQLAEGPGHYPTTAQLGTPGVSAIAGHSSGWGAPFMKLDRLHAGDLIIVKAHGGVFRYRITGVYRMDAKDTWVLKGDWETQARMKLVLTTCWPVMTSLHRLVVWADIDSMA